MSHPAWTLVFLGLALALGGALWLAGANWFRGFRLPGDIVIEQPQFRFYFPIVTCLVVSLLLTLIGQLIQRFLR